jgi:hypothetical protein
MNLVAVGSVPMKRPLISRRMFVLSGAALVLSARAPHAERASRDPAAILKEIYKGNDSRNAAFGLEESDRRKYLSKSLIELWAKADAKVNPRGDEVGPIDFDVTTNSQGMYVKSYSMTTERRDGERATLAVTLVAKGEWVRNSPEDNIVRYHFIREDGRWVIDDIGSTTDGKPGSLKDILLENLKD